MFRVVSSKHFKNQCGLLEAPMNNKLLELYFTITTWLLYSVAAIPEKKQLKTELRTFLFNKVFPVMFFFFWTPLVPMVTLKIAKFVAKKEWEDFLDIMHMYFLGCNTLYILYALQKTPRHYKNTMDKIKQHFLACDGFGLNDCLAYIFLWLAIAMSFGSYVIGSIYNGEVLVPVWIPFIDNDQPLSTLVYFAVWAYEGLAGVYMIAVYGILGPFIIVSTIVTIKEINFLICKINDLKFCNDGDQVVRNNYFTHKKNLNKTDGRMNTVSSFLVDKTVQREKEEIKRKRDDFLNTICCSEADTKIFIQHFITHHKAIMSVINEVSKIHHYVFLTQALFTITHSCFLAFNMYYTEHLFKVITKSSPILFVSYYLLYIYCWNGQRLTDKCEELFRSLYCCEWYNCPKSFKSSLIIMMQFCRLPVKYTGGGIVTASYETFLTGLQQSISYILLLKQLTPEKIR